MEFVHLRIHSDGSLLDSTFTPERLLSEAQKLQLEALALTDRDSLFRAVEFFQVAPSFQIRPILGIELSYFRSEPLAPLHRSSFCGKRKGVCEPRFAFEPGTSES